MGSWDLVRTQMESSSWSHNAEGVLVPRVIGILSQNGWVVGACYQWEGLGELEKKDAGGFGGTPKALALLLCAPATGRGQWCWGPLKCFPKLLDLSLHSGPPVCSPPHSAQATRASALPASERPPPVSLS